MKVFFRFISLLLGVSLILGPCRFLNEKSVRSIPLREMIGQMVVCGLKGSVLTRQHPVVPLLQRRFLGGIILMDYGAPGSEASTNIESPRQVAALVDSLQALAPVPLLICVDQEGGRVRRLKPRAGFPDLASAAWFGERNRPRETFDSARQTARVLAEAGIHLNLAPVVDLAVNPENPVIAGLDRAYSNHPPIVIRHASAFIRAHHQEGVACCLKHFPGHGSSLSDSHLGLVDITRTWSGEELIPFAALIDSGLTDAVMTAHIFNAQWDSDYPATLSRPVITGLLRDSLAWQGVIISDDLNMRAIRNHFGLETALRRALDAGVDLMLMVDNSQKGLEKVNTLLDCMENWVQNGEISPERIQASFQRIQQLKKRYVYASRR